MGITRSGILTKQKYIGKLILIRDHWFKVRDHWFTNSNVFGKPNSIRIHIYLYI